MTVAELRAALDTMPADALVEVLPEVSVGNAQNRPRPIVVAEVIEDAPRVVLRTGDR